jgi:hypothetical protein
MRLSEFDASSSPQKLDRSFLQERAFKISACRVPLFDGMLKRTSSSVVRTRADLSECKPKISKYATFYKSIKSYQQVVACWIERPETTCLKHCDGERKVASIL